MHGIAATTGMLDVEGAEVAANRRGGTRWKSPRQLQRTKCTHERGGGGGGEMREKERERSAPRDRKGLPTSRRAELLHYTCTVTTHKCTEISIHHHSVWRNHDGAH